jgi:hypothetical protein
MLVIFKNSMSNKGIPINKECSYISEIVELKYSNDNYLRRIILICGKSVFILNDNLEFEIT